VRDYQAVSGNHGLSFSVCTYVLWPDLQLKGIGNSVNILQADIPACGPSVVHITDGALLPLLFAAAPSSAPAATQG